jgi:hypothetical protein
MEWDGGIDRGVVVCHAAIEPLTGRPARRLIVQSAAVGMEQYVRRCIFPPQYDAPFDTFLRD